MKTSAISQTAKMEMNKHAAFSVSQEAMAWLEKEHPDVAAQCHVSEEQPRILLPHEVKQIREDLNLSQEEFARLLWSKTETIRSWETGRRQPGGPACKLMLQIKKEGHD